MENSNVIINNKDMAISTIRLIAMTMIISCHIFQYYDNEIAFWLNVGVQIFLIISGFLYGRKDDMSTPPILFLKRNFKKIYFDYWIVVSFAIMLYKFVLKYKFDIRMIIDLIFGFPSRVSGLGHFWFVSLISICYLATPMLYKIFKNKVGFLNVILCISVFEFVSHIIPIYIGAWLNCYLIGFILGKLYTKYGLKLIKSVFLLNLPITVILNTIKVYFKYFNKVEIPHIIKVFVNIIANYAHVCLGLLIFCIIFYGIHRSNIEFNRYFIKLLAFSDRYSYDIYLTHHIIILGPLSLIPYIGIFASVLLSIFIAIVIHLSRVKLETLFIKKEKF